MQLESPVATPQPNLWQDGGINRATCQTFLEKAFFGTGDETAIFTKMLHICYIGWWLA